MQRQSAVEAKQKKDCEIYWNLHAHKTQFAIRFRVKTTFRLAYIFIYILSMDDHFMNLSSSLIQAYWYFAKSQIGIG